jgi:inner membrane transporter RhtA
MVGVPEPLPVGRRDPSAPGPLRGASGAARAVWRSGGSAPLLLVAVAISTQAGSAIATRLFASAGVVGTLWLRVSMATVLLALLGRGSLRPPPPGSRLTLLGLGAVLTAMNVCFFESIARIPLGVAATIDFVGPLLVALVGSRGRLEAGCALLAGTGVLLLGDPGAHVDGVGMLLALGSGCCWAAYILLAKRAVSRAEPLTVLVSALVVSAALLTPWALTTSGHTRWQGSVLATALAVAVLATALPYVLELLALRRVRAATFGVLLSLEPAVAALVGLLILGQRLGALELVALACVVIASAAASSRANAPPLG